MSSHKQSSTALCVSIGETSPVNYPHFANYVPSKLQLGSVDIVRRELALGYLQLQAGLFKNLTLQKLVLEICTCVIFRNKPRLNKLAGHPTPVLSHNLLTVLGFSLVFRNPRLMWLGATLGIENSALFCGDRTSDST